MGESTAMNCCRRGNATGFGSMSALLASPPSARVVRDAHAGGVLETICEVENRA